MFFDFHRIVIFSEKAVQIAERRTQSRLFRKTSGNFCLFQAENRSKIQ